MTLFVNPHRHSFDSITQCWLVSPRPAYFTLIRKALASDPSRPYRLIYHFIDYLFDVKVNHLEFLKGLWKRILEFKQDPDTALRFGKFLDHQKMSVFRDFILLQFRLSNIEFGNLFKMRVSESNPELNNKQRLEETNSPIQSEFASSEEEDSTEIKFKLPAKCPYISILDLSDLQYLTRLLGNPHFKSSISSSFSLLLHNFSSFLQSNNTLFTHETDLTPLIDLIKHESTYDLECLQKMVRDAWKDTLLSGNLGTHNWLVLSWLLWEVQNQTNKNTAHEKELRREYRQKFFYICKFL